jgi:transglutaminase-like putative cysteine protease
MTLRLPRIPGTTGLAIGLAVALAGLAGYSVAQARWTANAGAHLPAVWLGLLCGAALALTRWRGRSATAYSLVASLIVAFEIVARVVVTPALATDVLRGLNVRLFIGAERVTGWIAALLAGAPVDDTGLFVALLAVTTWSAMAWLAWWLIRERRPLVSALPLLALLALNNHLSRQPAASFIALLVCVLLLVACLGFAELRRDWDRRRVDYADELALEWGAGAAVATLVIALAIAAAPFLATPEGWRAVAKFFEQPAARTASQLFPGVNAPPDAASAAFAQTPDLSRIGAPIPQSDEAVMWVRISDAPPPSPQSGGPGVAVPIHYWRNAAFGAYTGAGWRPAAPAEALPLSVAGRYPLQQRFDIVAPHSRALFAVNHPVSASVTLSADGFAQGGVSSYTVTSLATRVTATELITASTDYPAAIATVYRQLPEALPARVRELAARLSDGATTPYAKAVRIQNYLRANYPYRLDAPATPAGRDAVDYFLFEAPGGFCSHYASAMAVLLRAVEVPARVVTGFAMGRYDYERNAWRVPASAAHAWVEVYFPGYGWVEFEPTAAFAPPDYPGAPGAAPMAEPQPAPAEASITFGEVARLIAAAVIILLVLAWLARPLFVRAPPASERVRALYWQMRRALSRAGLRAAASTTPHEYLRAHAAALAPPLRSALAEATQVYERAEYGEQSPAPREVERVQMQWQRARIEWVKLWMARMTSPAGPLSWRQKRSSGKGETRIGGV